MASHLMRREACTEPRVDTCVRAGILLYFRSPPPVFLSGETPHACLLPKGGNSELGLGLQKFPGSELCNFLFPRPRAIGGLSLSSSTKHLVAVGASTTHSLLMATDY
jgi:hypothetical protein